ncbi:hypothetical protein OO015_07880 [Thermomicrobium sp. 4228-Ro]|uniref:hypothetical protein n=1 Tax=Thermomicrobium sp. 4228-Ro TaxID=2993937 RepID=UPI002248A5A3|nr:hypothetical protein [Thermomicrobium sp. 4228-Ro]MCX2727412.1 hypothetical protein [Thermomicrobium sp. 4228-Ro]
MRSQRAPAQLLSGLILGLLTSLFLVHHQTGQRLVVGSTGSTLSTVLLFDGRVIVLGGGSVPNAGVELADRATLPWQRPYELLIVPAWDTDQVTGALGFVERRAVRSVIIAGSPDDDPAWTILERMATARGLRFLKLNEPFAVPLGNQSVLEVIPRQDALLACLRVGNIGIGLVDAATQAEYADPCGRAAALVALRQSVRTDAPLVLRPEPRRGKDLAPVAPYEIQLGRGERVDIRLANGELRVPLAALVSLPESTPIAP